MADNQGVCNLNSSPKTKEVDMFRQDPRTYSMIASVLNLPTKLWGKNKLKCSNMPKFCCSLNKLRNLFQYTFSDLNKKLNGALTIQNKHLILIVHEKEQSFLNISAILLLFLIKFSGCEPFPFMYFFFLTLFSLTTCLTMIFSLLATPIAKGELSSFLGYEHITNDDFSFLMRALLH